MENTPHSQYKSLSRPRHGVDVRIEQEISSEKFEPGCAWHQAGYSGSGERSPNNEPGAGIDWRATSCVFLACADGRTAGGPGSSRYQECLTPSTLLVRLT